jgi:hypothetical protein
MPALTEAEYKATMGTPMTVVQPDDDFRPIPLGGYVDAIPASDLQGRDFTGRHVEKVYRPRPPTASRWGSARSGPDR